MTNASISYIPPIMSKEATKKAFDYQDAKQVYLNLEKADKYAKEQVGLDDRDNGGACGFAWVKIKGIRKDAIKKALLDYGFRPAYPSGLELWIHKYGQSVDAKSSYAMHFAKFMNEQVDASILGLRDQASRRATGLPFTSGSRLD